MIKKIIPRSGNENQESEKQSGHGIKLSKNTKSKKQNEFQIQAGKTYRTRDNKRHIKVETDHAGIDEYQFSGGGFHYTKNGQLFLVGKSSNDLVEEVLPLVVAPCMPKLYPYLTPQAAFGELELDCTPFRGTKACFGEASNPKDLVGAKKPPMSFIPPSFKAHVAMAFKDGASKYTPYNWRSEKVQAMIYLDAAMRHLDAYLDGEDVAKDSKVHHLAHAAACCAVLLDATETGNLIDNRPPKGKAAEIIERFTTN